MFLEGVVTAILRGSRPDSQPEAFSFVSSSTVHLFRIDRSPIRVDYSPISIDCSPVRDRSLRISQLQLHYSCDPSLVGNGSGGSGCNGYPRDLVLAQAGTGSRLSSETLKVTQPEYLIADRPSAAGSPS